MKVAATLENFKPRLRAGQVIPQGSRIIFETDDPYNQIALPMALADLVLLCSGQFTVRQIIEKIYRKQGAVPFKWILSALHALHQGGFFENAEELILSQNLESWVTPKRSRWHLSWRFGQRIVADSRSPLAFYGLTLFALIFALLGLQFFPWAPVKMVESWVQEVDLIGGLWSLFVVGSIMQTLRYILCAVQLLLLTGKAYNASLRLSIWGVHLHIGDEANVLFENRLYTVMFHLSQILAPWAFVYLGSLAVSQIHLTAMMIVSLSFTLYEINPFAPSEGRKLIKSLLIPSDRDIVSWHFEKSTIISTFSPELRQQDQDFARICTIWGAIWLLAMVAILHETAIFFGPDILSHLLTWSESTVSRALALVAWLAMLFYVVQAFIERVFLFVATPVWSKVRARAQKLSKAQSGEWPPLEIIKRVEGLPLFSHFHEQYLAEIVAKSEILKLKKGTLIIRQGDSSRDLFVLLDGQAEVARMGSPGFDDEWISELGPVSVFGEAALVDDSPRSAQVTAKTPGAALKVPISVIRQVAQDAKTIRHLEDFRNAILVNQFFTSSPVFRSLSGESIDFLSSRGALTYFNLGQKVFSQGDVGDSIFLILRGSVDVFIHGKHIKSLKQGSFFGEIALIANIPRTASVVTREPCVFFKVSADSFWEVLVQYIDLGVFIETVSESRLKEDLEVTPLIKSTGTDSK